MATMNISLPDPMRKWVETQIEGGQYSNNSDYIRDLIRKDQQRTEKLHALQDAITKGLDSGQASKLDMAAIKQKAKQKAKL
ncbi:MAG: type II toxin-antitoxin system ParD family antitoxin [Gammaproteobacteria bacterium]|nr:MAG: type II toxin-antitoxin system ParD family antitoxin [Gammaproteobacteria bacterium]